MIQGLQNQDFKGCLFVYIQLALGKYTLLIPYRTIKKMVTHTITIFQHAAKLLLCVWTIFKKKDLAEDIQPKISEKLPTSYPGPFFTF